MRQSLASELPPEVLERIFSVGRPGSKSGEPLLDTRQRLRCQLACKAWQYALNPRRWPLWRLELQAEVPDEAPPAALWVQRMRPGVQQLHIELVRPSGPGLVVQGRARSAVPWADSPAVEALHGVLLALPASALHTLSLRGPSPLLEVLLLKLSRFTGLLCLFLLNERQTLWSGAAGESDRALLPALLQHVPPRLQVLSASGFAGVRLETGSAGAGQPAAAAAQRSGSGAEPTQLLPRLEQLFITSCRDVVLDVPLPRLTELSVGNCDGTSLAGEQLHLPQLISLQLLSSGHWVRPGTSELARLRCGAMPLLSRLVCQYRVEASDSFAALQHLTHLELALVEGRPDSAKAVVGALPPTVCSLSITVRPDIQAVWSRFGGFGTAYGGVLCTYLAAIVPQITRLEINDTTCLAHLPTWPHLQELVLCNVDPTDIIADRIAQLEAATSLRRLAFAHRIAGQGNLGDVCRIEEERMEDLRQILPNCTVEQY